MRLAANKSKNPALYNSNNQKMVDPQLSSRNAPNQSNFVAGNSDISNAPLRDLPINLQKSGDLEHNKVNRQASFALYPGKRSSNFPHQKLAQNSMQPGSIRTRGEAA